MQERKLKVLISAYACEPNKGSEPGVGWNWVKQIARYNEVWVITRENNQKVIEEELNKNPLPNVHFCYYDLPCWFRFWKKGARGIHLYYYLWQVGIFMLGKRLHSNVKFDIIHHITFVSFRFPSFLAFLPVPFIWGPLAGGQNSPYFMRKEYTIQTRVKERIRDISQVLSLIDPFVRLTMKRARLILATNQDTAKIIPKNFNSKIEIFPVSGLSKNEFDNLENSKDIAKKESVIKILSVGEMVPRKVFGLALKTLAHLNFNTGHNFKLVLIGGGPEFKRLKKMASQLGISENVEFTGKLPRKETLRRMKEADIFLFPSIREGTPFVVLEAMVAGKPVVCLDLGGSGEIVTEECGIKIKPHSPEQVLQGLVNAVEQLAKDPELRQHMGETGRKHVEEFYMWDRKGEEIKKIYGFVE